MKSGREWLGAIMRDEHLQPSHKNVAWALESYRNAATGRCFPAVATLAKDTHLSPATVARAIRELEVGGWLARTEGRGRDHTFYTLLHDGQPLPLRLGKNLTGKNLRKSSDGGKNLNRENSNNNAQPLNEPHARARGLAGRVIAHDDSAKVTAWDHFLTHHGWPPLGQCAERGVDGDRKGFAVPTLHPPRNERAEDVAQALAFFERHGRSTDPAERGRRA